MIFIDAAKDTLKMNYANFDKNPIGRDGMANISKLVRFFYQPDMLWEWICDIIVFFCSAKTSVFNKEQVICNLGNLINVDKLLNLIIFSIFY